MTAGQLFRRVRLMLKNVTLVYFGKKSRETEREAELGKRMPWLSSLVLKPARGQTPEQTKLAEAKVLLEKVGEKSILIVLDERGKDMTSVAFASQMNAFLLRGGPIYVAIGGADGHDESVRQRADLVLRFSRMTWTHDLCRLMLKEQLYRADQILSGGKFHKE